MYIITKTSAIWLDTSIAYADAAVGTSNTTATPIPAAPLGTMRLAARPLKLPHLTCLGLRYEVGGVRVQVVRKGRREWLPVVDLLSPDMFAHWLEHDFVKEK